MRAEHQAVLDLEVPVIVEVGRTRMPTGDILTLAPGAIIELPKSSDDELEILVNNKTIGTGIAVKIGENFGIQLSCVGGVRERIEALAAGLAIAGEPGLAPQTE